MSKPAGERYSTVGEFVEALTGHALPAPRSGNSLPPPDVGFATGSRMPDAKETGKEAFANTVGSGDHADAVAATVDSGNRANSVVAAPSGDADKVARGNAATVSTNQGEPLALAPTVSPPARSRAPLVIAGVIAVAAAGAVAFFALRCDKPATPAEQVAKQDEAPGPVPPPDDRQAPVPTDDHATSGSATGSSKSAETLGESASASDADSQTGSNTDSNTGSKDVSKTGSKDVSKTGSKSATHTGSKTGSTSDDDADGDATAKQKLNDADTALKASEWGRAEQLANAVMNSEDANLKQKARAAMIHGIAQCLGHNNEEGALTDLRRIKGAPAMRLKLLKVCHQAGFLKAER
jgi:hypothetical protein